MGEVAMPMWCPVMRRGRRCVEFCCYEHGWDKLEYDKKYVLSLGGGGGIIVLRFIVLMHFVADLEQQAVWRNDSR